MSRMIKTALTLALVAALSAWALPVLAQQDQAGSTLTVQVRDLELRQDASFLSPVAGMLHYGDQVTATSRQGEWIEVQQMMGEQSGWAHQSALTDQELDLQAGGSMTGGADSDEVALAGKGFNRQVESEYRQGHPGMHYDWIDWMETIRIEPAEMQTFKDAGESAAVGQAPGGGAQ